jgi:hypothetical protein
LDDRGIEGGLQGGSKQLIYSFKNVDFEKPFLYLVVKKYTLHKIIIFLLLSMDDAKINQAINLLDRLVPKTNLDAEFRAFGEVALYGSKESFLRLGIEFLKKAYDEKELFADLDYIFSDDSEFIIDHITKNKEYFRTISS